MATVYRIHPSIGVARVGNHRTAFFVGPEEPGSPGVEIGADGTETTLESYKADGLVKRQAARFRVIEYEQDAAGTLTLVGECGPDVHVEWSVDLCNRKAALDRTLGPAGPRNTSVADRDSLVVRGATPVTVAGPDQAPEQVRGSFLGTEVYLGEAFTDAHGRLVVLGGRGASASVPPGEPLTSFANNDLWHDDVADGPVTATVTRTGEKPVVVHDAAWVVVAPPDFAPGITAGVSLYDVAFQCGIDKGALTPDAVPSFTRHIRPMVERTTSLAWVDDWAEWSPLLPVDWATLADPGPGAQPARKAMADRVRTPGLALFGMPAFLDAYLTQWVDGNFVSDLDVEPAPDPLPVQLDRAALDHCSGANFFPGIEGGQNLKDPNLYGQPFRLDPTNAGKVYPGCLTEIMALPWQADFYACDGGVWWPSQRPDQVMTDGADVPGSAADWNAPIGGFQGMVEHVLQLGFVVPQSNGGGTVFVEVDRDPKFPRP